MFHADDLPGMYLLVLMYPRLHLRYPRIFQVDNLMTFHTFPKSHYSKVNVIQKYGTVKEFTEDLSKNIQVNTLGTRNFQIEYCRLTYRGE
jgi:hypothetical protein